jgi:hypothetical protein
MNPISIADLIDEADKAASPEYRAGYDRIFGKKKRPKKAVAPPDTKKAAKPKTPEAERAKALKQQQSRQKVAKTRDKKVRAKEKSGAEQASAARLAKQAEIKQSAAKKSGVEKKQGLNTIPAQIAHCMMALHVKRKKSKEAAWNICRWAMTKYGYLSGPYRVNTKMPKAVKQTGKGSRRSFQHGMEKKPLNGGVPGNGGTKFARFVTMFKTLEPKILLKK